MREELLKGLTEEQIAKVKACKSQEEMLALAKEEGIELTDEQLEAVSGGHCQGYLSCPKCGAIDFHIYDYKTWYQYECDCGYKWQEHFK